MIISNKQKQRILGRTLLSLSLSLSLSFTLTLILFVQPQSHFLISLKECLFFLSSQVITFSKQRETERECVYVYIYTCICMYVCMYVCMYIYIYLYCAVLQAIFLEEVLCFFPGTLVISPTHKNSTHEALLYSQGKPVFPLA